MQCNPLCVGCSVLGTIKPTYSIMDYEGLKNCDILFLSDSLKSNKEDFSYNSFRTNDLSILERAIRKHEGLKFQFSAAVKCPDVKESDMTPSDRNLCREHLYETIRRTNPKIIFACGNLAVVMLLKRSGVMDKRGSYFPIMVPFPDGEREFRVIPLIHPTQVFIEPKYLFLFRMDID